MPGHKGKAIKDFDLFALDVTELPQTDNLLSPKSAIKKAEELAADAYGAGSTVFLTCGSSAGVLAMMLYIGGGKVIVSRDCHISAINGIALAGIDPIFVFPSDGNMISAVDLIEKIDRHPGMPVFVTYPNSYGQCFDIESVAKSCKANGSVLFVDEAHGAHFAFDKGFPISSGEAGASFWVQSAHKTMPALNQASFLHMAQKESLQKMMKCVSMVHSTSPSFPIMLTMDLARDYFTKNKGQIESWIDTCIKICEDINDIEGIACNRFGKGVFDFDRTRLCINTAGRGVSGYDAQKHLMNCGIQPEMANAEGVVLITSPLCLNFRKKLLSALNNLQSGSIRVGNERLMPKPQKAIGIREAMLMEQNAIPYEKVKAGMIAGRAVGLYPPGLPLLVPGEILDDDCIGYLDYYIRKGHEIFGMDDGAFAYIGNDVLINSK